MGVRPGVLAVSLDDVSRLLSWAALVDGPEGLGLDGDDQELRDRLVELRNVIDVHAETAHDMRGSQIAPLLNDACVCGHTFGCHCTPEFPNGGYCAASDTASPGYGCSCIAFHAVHAESQTT